MAQMNWITSFAEGLEKATSENRLAYVDFFSPG